MRDRARALGVRLGFRDVDGKRRRASDETLRAVVDALGAPPPAPPIEPVVVAWDGSARVSATRRADCVLRTETGDELSFRVEPGTPKTLALDLGYHTIEYTSRRQSFRTTVIAAPRRAPVPADRLWGVFLPLYALRAKRTWGTADFTDLGELVGWTQSLGGDFVATLPLLAAYLDGDVVDPSPYSPVSRLFWNELYVDVAATPESAASKRLIGSASFRSRLRSARRGDLVDYAKSYALKREAIEVLAEEFFASRRRSELDAFLRDHPDADAYADFRASRPGGASREFHLYAQLVADRQLASIGQRLELDFPVGVHPDGFDVHHFGVFASGVSAGAPPDGFFRSGQNWGFAPLHPGRSRETGHAYMVRAIRALTRHASLLRIDHVMGLHRMYWIPDGMAADEGAYVVYPHDELYAILTLEAGRADTVIVGEDLGTVPAEVRTAMRRHGVLRSYVLQFEGGARPPPAAALASLNTHDTATFAEAMPDGDVRECLELLARSPARAVVVNLEDLWGEDRRQNIPGTTSDEHPNWRRRARLSLEELRSDRRVTRVLESVDKLRRS